MTDFINIDHAHRARSRISGLTCLIAVLLGVALLSEPPLAATAVRKAGGVAALSPVRVPSFARRELPRMKVM